MRWMLSIGNVLADSGKQQHSTLPGIAGSGGSYERCTARRWEGTRIGVGPMASFGACPLGFFLFA